MFHVQSQLKQRGINSKTAKTENKQCRTVLTHRKLSETQTGTNLEQKIRRQPAPQSHGIYLAHYRLVLLLINWYCRTMCPSIGAQVAQTHKGRPGNCSCTP